jgi:hypothetical protein
VLAAALSKVLAGDVEGAKELTARALGELERLAELADDFGES